MMQPTHILVGLRRTLEPLDRVLLVALLATLSLGLAIQYSASDTSSDVTLQHAHRIAIGLLAMLVVAHIPPKHLRRWTPAVFGLSLLLLGLVLFYGTGTGTRRWLPLGPATLQPSELLKITVPMMMAHLLGHSPMPPRFLRMLAALLLLGAAAWLVALQPDLGTATLILLVGLSVLFLSGIRLRWFIGLGGLAGISLPFAWQHALYDYQKDRILAFFNPESDPLGSGYNIIQSQIAIGSGGLHGKGWTHSTQAQFDFLPEHSTDFVFSVFAEEFGLLGVALLIALYLALLWRMVAMSDAGSSLYGRLLAGGLGLSFLLHILVNIAMAVGYAPVVGLPLPLMSFGGSAMISTMIAFGMIMAIRRSALTRPA